MCWLSLLALLPFWEGGRRFYARCHFFFSLLSPILFASDSPNFNIKSDVFFFFNTRAEFSLSMLLLLNRISPKDYREVSGLFGELLQTVWYNNLSVQRKKVMERYVQSTVVSHGNTFSTGTYFIQKVFYYVHMCSHTIFYDVCSTTMRILLRACFFLPEFSDP